MLEVVIGIVAFLVAALTLFSGFGLGTLLMPAFAVFFPLPVAVAATAVVHGLNNLFKLGLLRRQVDWGLVLRFGVPAMRAAFAGAALLKALAGAPRLFSWSIDQWTFHVTPVGLLMGLLIIGFAVLELRASSRPTRAHAPRALWLGGLLSGFFGGLSGHQGALRAMFLGPLALAPAAFAATQASIAVMVDAARTTVYGFGFTAEDGQMRWGPIVVATLCAFAGSYLGARLLPKVTVGFVRRITAVLLVVIGAWLAAGLI